MSNGASRKPHFCDCGWNGHRDCALWITSRPRGGQAHLCPWPRAERCGRIQYVRRASVALCGKTSIGATKAEHLWPCAQRGGRIGHESRASLALCGKTRAKDARKPSICGLMRKDASKGRARPAAGELAQTEGRGRYGAGRGAAGYGGRTPGRGRTGSSQEVRSAPRSWPPPAGATTSRPAKGSRIPHGRRPALRGCPTRRSGRR
jgi:hypothetical protein